MRKVVACITCLAVAGAAMAETTITLRIRELQKEYTQTAQQVRQGQEHLLRLEGAISILQKISNDEQTSATEVVE